MRDDPGNDGLNLSSEQPTQQDLRPQEQQIPYDPARDREIARARIAGGLLQGFFLAVLGTWPPLPSPEPAFRIYRPFSTSSSPLWWAWWVLPWASTLATGSVEQIGISDRQARSALAEWAATDHGA
jgi:hypothetical protein